VVGVVLTQCQATTQSGDSCSREATDGEYCYQHASKKSEPTRSKDYEKDYNLGKLKADPEKVAEVLIETGGSVSDAADMLPIACTTIWEYCQRYDVCKEARFMAKRQTSDLARKTFREMMELRGDEVSWAEARKAAKNWADLYDDETEADKVDVNLNEDKKREKVRQLLDK